MDNYAGHSPGVGGHFGGAGFEMNAGSAAQRVNVGLHRPVFVVECRLPVGQPSVVDLNGTSVKVRSQSSCYSHLTAIV